ncbi:hypothetical protein QCA50_008914 [Cerrena zonata]|uniref:DUF6535 domain-containing protein n=1 Tax=Cerrena zonata TaxID=2478898 RepID=A0AAW0G1S7_9APHY
MDRWAIESDKKIINSEYLFALLGSSDTGQENKGKGRERDKDHVDKGDQDKNREHKGWVAMDQAVKRFDEDLIKKYTDDIDTLLVFAGLFSAVVTTLIVESYKNLTPDPTDQATKLLNQTFILLQTLTFALNGSTAIASSQSQPPIEVFRVDKPDIRINVLWFSSLLLSLVTASMGILVKSWLREYLTTDHTSPRTRLRIRFFRFVGLRKWRVFAIVGIFSVLMQIALGLFFLGLCFFTANIHHSIGITSLVISSLWATVVAVSILLPITASHCPYKLSLPGRGLTWIRKQIYGPFIAHPRKLPSSRPPLFPGTDSSSSMALSSETRSIPPTECSVTSKISWKLRDLLKGLRRKHQYLLEALKLHNPNEYMQRDYRSFVRRFAEEEALAEIHHLDHHIIIEVDAVQADDQLLPSVIVQSFRETNAANEAVIPFVLRCLQSRQLITSNYWTNIEGPLARDTTPHIWLPIATLVVDKIIEEIQKQRDNRWKETVEWYEWMLQGIRLLICNAEMLPLPDQWSRMLSQCTRTEFTNMVTCLSDLLSKTIPRTDTYGQADFIFKWREFECKFQYSSELHEQHIIPLWADRNLLSLDESIQRLEILLGEVYGLAIPLPEKLEMLQRAAAHNTRPDMIPVQLRFTILEHFSSWVNKVARGEIQSEEFRLKEVLSIVRVLLDGDPPKSVAMNIVSQKWMLHPEIVAEVLKDRFVSRWNYETTSEFFTKTYGGASEDERETMRKLILCSLQVTVGTAIQQYILNPSLEPLDVVDVAPWFSDTAVKCLNRMINIFLRERPRIASNKLRQHLQDVFSDDLLHALVGVIKASGKEGEIRNHRIKTLLR